LVFGVKGVPPALSFKMYLSLYFQFVEAGKLDAERANYQYLQDLWNQARL